MRPTQVVEDVVTNAASVGLRLAGASVAVELELISIVLLPATGRFMIVLPLERRIVRELVCAGFGAVFNVHQVGFIRQLLTSFQIIAFFVVTIPMHDLLRGLRPAIVTK